MPAAIAHRNDFDADSLRSFARRCRDAKQRRRLLSIAAVYEGMNRGEAARIGGMDCQVLRDWVLRFNAEGPHSLTDRKPPGPHRRLNDDQLRELAVIGETGPQDGLVRC